MGRGLWLFTLAALAVLGGVAVAPTQPKGEILLGLPLLTLLLVPMFLFGAMVQLRNAGPRLVGGQRGGGPADSMAVALSLVFSLLVLLLTFHHGMSLPALSVAAIV